MRGFLGFVVLLLVALVVAAVVAVPAIVRPMVVDAVRAASPFGDQPIEVEVDINPVSLMLGSIDRIHVTGANLQAEGVDITAVDLVLTDVLTGSRTFEGLSGRLSGVSLPFVQSSTLVIETIDLSGRSGDVTALARLDLRATLALIGNAFADAGIAVDSLELADGGVAFGLFNQRVVVPVGVDTGALIIPDVAGGQLVIVEPGPDDPWRITGVAMTPSGMEVRVSLEPDEVLGGRR
jgi:hypothetical protein